MLGGVVSIEALPGSQRICVSHELQARAPPSAVLLLPLLPPPLSFATRSCNDPVACSSIFTPLWGRSSIVHCIPID